MRQEPEVEQQKWEEDDLKRCSSSSADSVADFIHSDYVLSSTETLPSLHPPTLPEKRRSSGAGEDTCLPFIWGKAAEPKCRQRGNIGICPALHEESHTCCDDVTGPDEPLSSPLSPSSTPPPLPEKKWHIHQYLQVCWSYDAQSAAKLYPHRYTHNSKQLIHSHLDIDSASSPELPPAPALPPKKRQQYSDDQSKEQLIRDSLQQQEEEEELEQQEEVLLTDQQEILHRITMKPEVAPTLDLSSISFIYPVS
ncbi:hypothetical protein PAMA_017791 [Pampus argenteus]